jgi:xylan 1,4-beta-xylosidase
LGETEIADKDNSSWACKNKKGDVQVLLWDYTYTLPDSVNNQSYYVRDLPAKPKGEVELAIAGMPKGKYRLEVYQTGYKVNDAYTTYVSFNKPDQLSRAQVDALKKQNNGAAILKENITVNPSGTFLKKLKIRENDVFLINMIKL